MSDIDTLIAHLNYLCIDSLEIPLRRVREGVRQGDAGAVAVVFARLADELERLQGDLAAAEKKLSLIEQFCLTSYSPDNGDEREETILRRIVWAVRGEHESLPPPYRDAR